MKTDIQVQPDGKTLTVTITCSPVELALLGESLQQAIDERSQKFGTYLMKAAQKFEK